MTPVAGFVVLVFAARAVAALLRFALRLVWRMGCSESFAGVVVAHRKAVAWAVVRCKQVFCFAAPVVVATFVWCYWAASVAQVNAQAIVVAQPRSGFVAFVAVDQVTEFVNFVLLSD